MVVAPCLFPPSASAQTQRLSLVSATRQRRTMDKTALRTIHRVVISRAARSSLTPLGPTVAVARPLTDACANRRRRPSRLTQQLPQVTMVAPRIRMAVAAPTTRTRGAGAAAATTAAGTPTVTARLHHRMVVAVPTIRTRGAGVAAATTAAGTPTAAARTALRIRRRRRRRRPGLSRHHHSPAVVMILVLMHATVCVKTAVLVM